MHVRDGHDWPGTEIKAFHFGDLALRFARYRQRFNEKGRQPMRTYASANLDLKIGVIGAGSLGGTLARLWAQAGYHVMLAARGLAPVCRLAGQLGPNVHVGTPAEAAAWGDVVVLAVPHNAISQIGNDLSPLLKGKVVIDTSNPLLVSEEGTAFANAACLPGAHLVRAFSSINFESLSADARRTGELIGVPLAAAYLWPLEIAAQLVADAGFEPIIVGGLSAAKWFDAGHPGYGIHTVRELKSLMAA
jgi:predicted dinucleotide-binding enzyme